MILRILGGSMVALTLGLFSENVRADQTFLCEDGRMLQVKLAELGALKRREPCIAAHYGLTIKPMPLPVRRPRDFSMPLLKGAQVIEPTRGEMGAVASVSSDYRNVRIINARPGEQGWYAHSRSLIVDQGPAG